MSSYFKKYEDFLNEDKENREKKKQERKDKRASKKAIKLENDLEKAKSKGNYKSVEKIKDKLSKIDSDINTDNENNLDKENDDNTENTSDINKKDESDSETDDKKEIDINKETKDDFRKMTPEQLNNRLGDWNAKFSQEFKFKNNMPQTPSKNLSDLMNSISPERKSGVSSAIQNLVKFFSNKSFEGQDIEISGYTSTTATESYNASLSDRRAESVLNAIEELMKDEGIDTKINFSTVGHGEDKNYLIILNDTESSSDIKDIKLRDPNLVDNETLEKIKDNPDARQELNRRVLVKIANLPMQEKSIDIVEPVENTEGNDNKITVDKPEQPTPENIQFNYDSYILIKESEVLLKQLAGEIKSWNENNEDEIIDNIFISAHTKKPTDSNPKQEKIQDELLFVLSTNRAYTIKRYLQQEIGSDLADKIKFYLYPVSSNMKQEKKVVINFDFSKHMQEAKKIFSELSTQYNVENGERGYSGKNYTTNDKLRDVIIDNLKVSTKDGQVNKEIPLELWYTEGRFGLGQEVDLAKFKEKMQNTLSKGKYNFDIRDFVYNSK